jgi:hypothetical protein
MSSSLIEHVSGCVDRLAGHAPVTLREYLAAHPESLDHVRTPPVG